MGVLPEQHRNGIAPAMADATEHRLAERDVTDQ
jgi:hypothetical protein